MLNAFSKLDKEDANKTLQTFTDTAGLWHILSNNAVEYGLKQLDLRPYLLGAMYKAATSLHTTRAANFKELNEQIKHIIDTTDSSGTNMMLEMMPNTYDNLIADLLGASLARFMRLENPSGSLYESLRNTHKGLEAQLAPRIDFFSETGFTQGKNISQADIFDFIEYMIKQGEAGSEVAQAVDLLPKLREKYTAYKGKDSALGLESQAGKHNDPTTSSTPKVDSSLTTPKQKTIEKIDSYASTPEFKALSTDKQEAILSLKSIEPSPMPQEIAQENLENLFRHFNSKQDKAQREFYAKLFNDTKENPHITLEVKRDNEIRQEYIKAYQHKDTHDLYYIAITKENDTIKVTGYPITKIKDVINQIKNAEKVVWRHQGDLTHTALDSKESLSLENAKDIIPHTLSKKQQEKLAQIDKQIAQSQKYLKEAQEKLADFESGKAIADYKERWARELKEAEADYKEALKNANPSRLREIETLFDNQISNLQWKLTDEGVQQFIRQNHPAKHIEYLKQELETLHATRQSTLESTPKAPKLPKITESYIKQTLENPTAVYETLDPQGKAALKEAFMEKFKAARENSKKWQDLRTILRNFEAYDDSLALQQLKSQEALESTPQAKEPTQKGLFDEVDSSIEVTHPSPKSEPAQPSSRADEIGAEIHKHFDTDPTPPTPSTPTPQETPKVDSSAWQKEFIEKIKNDKSREVARYYPQGEALIVERKINDADVELISITKEADGSYFSTFLDRFISQEQANTHKSFLENGFKGKEKELLKFLEKEPVNIGDTGLAFIPTLNKFFGIRSLEDNFTEFFIQKHFGDTHIPYTSLGNLGPKAKDNLRIYIDKLFKDNGYPFGFLINNKKTIQRLTKDKELETITGKGAVETLLIAKMGHIENAFYKEGFGAIDLVWGEVTGSGKEAKGWGLAKIIEKHGDEFQDIAKELDNIIQNGKVVKTHNGYNITLGDYKVGLNIGWNENGIKIGENKWVVTAFDNSKLQSEKQGSNSASFTKGETLPLNSSDIIPQPQMPKDNSDPVKTFEYFKNDFIKEYPKALEFYDGHIPMASSLSYRVELSVQNEIEAIKEAMNNTAKDKFEKLLKNIGLKQNEIAQVLDTTIRSDIDFTLWRVKDYLDYVARNLNNFPQEHKPIAQEILAHSQEILNMFENKTPKIEQLQKKRELISRFHDNARTSDTKEQGLLKELITELYKPQSKQAKEALESTPPKETPTTPNADSSASSFTYTTGEAKGIAELRKDLKQALEPSLNKEIVNKEQGLSGVITTEEVKKIMSKKAVDKSVANGFSRDEHIEVAKHIERLFTESKLLRSHKDYKENPNILQVHRFIKDIEVNGKEANALITLFEKMQGKNKIYTIELESLESTPLSTQAKSAGVAVEAQSAAATPTEAAPIAKTDGESIAQDSNALLKSAMKKFAYDEKKAKDLLEWHKDSSPLTKDENGLPKVFYHGSENQFETFDRDKTGLGYFFTEQRELAEPFKDDKNLMYPSFLKIKKVFDSANPTQAEWDAYKDFIIQRAGEQHKQAIEKHFKQWQKDLKSEGANPYTLPTFFLWKELERLGVELESSGRISFLNYGSELENKKLVEFLQSRGYDAMTHTMHMRGYDSKVLSVFDSNQIKHIENRGVESESGRKYFNESSPNIFHSNPHLGAGLLGGSVAGVEQDENGQWKFSPEKFALGLLGGVAGSKAVAKGLEWRARKVAKSYPNIAKDNPQLMQEIAKRDLHTYATASTHNALSRFLHNNKLFDINPQLFAGEKALANEAYAPHKARLERAKELEAKGAKEIEIWEQTGWYKDKDQRWKFEISQRGGELLTKDEFGRPYKRAFLSKILQDDELFNAYPKLKNMRVIEDKKLGRGVNASYDPKLKDIYIKNLQAKEAKISLYHELQHAIQDIEGFAYGFKDYVTSDENFHKYAIQHREVEARNVESRMNLPTKKDVQTLKRAAKNIDKHIENLKTSDYEEWYKNERINTEQSKKKDFLALAQATQEVINQGKYTDHPHETMDTPLKDTIAEATMHGEALSKKLGAKAGDTLKSTQKVQGESKEMQQQLQSTIQTHLENLPPNPTPQPINEAKIKALIKRFDNIENLQEHLNTRADTKARQEIFSLLDDTLQTPQVHYKKDGKDKYLKRYKSERKEPYFYLLVTKDENKTFITHFKTRDSKYLSKEITKAQEIIQGADIIEALSQRTGDI